jgi:hypothetical protein
VNCDYEDIRSRISEKPIWFDENAVPRYVPFAPRECANIYCAEVVLMLVTCQACDHEFNVALTRDRMQSFELNGRTLADEIRADVIHYGDPPNVGCCPAGPTMNSEPKKVLEYWHRHHSEHVGPDSIVANVESYFEWRRESDLEVSIGNYILDSRAVPG